MKRKINKVVILGSGVMGSRIACHFANVGCEVYLLDILPKELTDVEKAKGLTLDNPKVRNRIADENLKSITKSKPSPLYKKSLVSRIKTGNFDDNMDWIGLSDWTIEVVIENLAIKKSVFENVEKYRKEGSLITSNTSGIPINSMLEGRSEDFQEHFCGTHFFNPPRYLQLLEIIPSSKTKPEIVDFLMEYGDVHLGKRTVLCKDTPSFIANRIGVFSIMTIFRLMKEHNLSIEEVDLLTGPVTGKPKSATFRTSDVVGLDTLVKVAQNTFEACPEDESRDVLAIPDFIKKMLDNGLLGDKTKKGFYKKVKNEKGESEILVLDLDTFEYKSKVKARFGSVTAVRPIELLQDRLKALHKAGDKAGKFLKELSFRIFVYASNRIPEISDEVYRLDDAMKTGFGWELGPFEIWDTLGVKKVVDEMKTSGNVPADWVLEMIEAGIEKFYLIENGVRKYYDIESKSYKEIPGRKELIILENLAAQKPVWKNSGSVLHDLGDGVANLEFRTKMNSIGSEILEGINKSIEICEKDFKGLVIGNDAPNFSAGANLAMIFMLAMEQEFDELELAVRMFQKSTMRMRYSSIPVVLAPHGLALGGGCESCMHADSVYAAAETYIGLVEVGVGLIPAGGGTKEMVVRASDSFIDGGVEFPELQKRFLAIAMATVATSAYEAFDIGLFRPGTDKVVVNASRVLAEAKKAVIAAADAGYTQPVQRDDIKVLGRTALASLLIGVNAYREGEYISDHDKKIAEKLAFVMCGGDLSAPGVVTEQYLLDLEREAFMSLLGERKTLERIQSILNTGKPLRN